MAAPDRAAYCSWSGGKDCALALHIAMQEGWVPGLLLTMMTESGERSRSHGLRRSVLEKQAAALGLPILFGSAAWSGYEAAFGELVATAVSMGMRAGIFGDLAIQGHRDWVEAVTARAGSRVYFPLWGWDRRRLLRHLIDEGFAAVIVAVRRGALSETLLGETIDRAVFRRFERAGIDPAGENGEYHTLVVDGPILRQPLRVTFGDRVLRDDMWFLDVEAT